jgi:hypothetical protein
MYVSYNYHDEHKQFKRKTLSPRQPQGKIPQKKSGQKSFFPFKRAALFFLGCAILGSIFFVGLIGWYSKDLPDLGRGRRIERAGGAETLLLQDQAQLVALDDAEGRR